MRQLFQKQQEETRVAPVLPTTLPTAVAAQSVSPSAAEIVSEKAVAEKEGMGQSRRVKPVLTPQVRAARRKRAAIITLAASLLVGARWFQANRDPVYPRGEGVYAPQIAPAWGKLKTPNAGTFYMAATDAFDYASVPNTIQTDSAAAQKPVVAKAQPALALLRQGMQYPYYGHLRTNYFHSDPVEATGIGRPVANYVATRELARVLVAEANVRASEGNTAGAIQSSLDVVRYGIDGAADEHSLVEGMIGSLVQGMGAKEGLKHVAGLSGADARAGAARLETMLASERSTAQMITADRGMVYETLGSMYRAGNAQEVTSAYSMSAPAIGEKLAYNAGVFVLTKQGVVNEFATQYDRVLTRLKMPYQQSKGLPSVAESWNPLVRMATPNYERAFQQTTRTSAMNRVLLARLAVQAYRGEHNGAAPASLAELTAGASPYLKAVPTDPFSRSGRDPLRYEATTGDAYSVGENGLDDRGAGDDRIEADVK